ncbi:MAG: acyl-CoA synthetase FdrA [bacterium]
MSIVYELQKDTYYDSVTLMLVSSDLKKEPGVEEVVVGMGTDYNIDSLKRLDMFKPELEKATPNDLIFCIKADDEATAGSALKRAQQLLTEKKSAKSTSGYNPPTQESAGKEMPDANMVIISIPGEHAFKEADQALDNDRHVMLFSDNVSIEEELKLKKKAVEKELLMMGPDCGTAIINSLPLAFANEVREGNVGIVAASGTGLQEVSSIIHRLGGGISQGIGVGGRDLSEDIGGLMTIQAAQALEEDPRTDVILLVSKPPAKSVLKKLFAELKNLNKPVVVFFIGADPALIEAEGFNAAANLEDAAVKTCRLAADKDIKPLMSDEEIKDMAAGISLTGKYLRGLYSGGTLCDEAQLLLQELDGDIYSNTPVEGCKELNDLYESKNHTIIDLGEDEFTRGRAHPMIDPTLRQERIVQEFKDRETAVIMLDVVLGSGSHPDMAGALVEAIEKGRSETTNRPLITASLCGTDEDFQDYAKQQKILEDAGVKVFPSNVSMVKFVKSLLA